MARIVLVHGAFNELWGPHELKSRWLPAVRDGLWHQGVEITDDDVEVCFYGDLFRRAPGTEEDAKLEQSRAGIAESLHDMGADTVAMLGQAASDAAFDRTVDMVTIMATDPDLRVKMRARIEPLVDDRRASSWPTRSAPCCRTWRWRTTRSGRCTRSSRSARRWRRRWWGACSSRRRSTASVSGRVRSSGG